jgi:hypothetical protein
VVIQHNEWTAQAPKPTAGTIGKVGTEGSENQTLEIKMTWTHQEALSYAKEAMKSGFNVEAYLYEELSTCFEGKNAAGYELGVSDTRILIVKPRK